MSTRQEDSKRLILAIDFDGTIVDHAFPRIGNIKPNAKEVINQLHEEGHRIIIWTCRNNTEPMHKGDEEWNEAPVPMVAEFLRKNGIKFDSINENHPDMGFWLQSRKVFADIYIDDRNIGGFPGWHSVIPLIRVYQRDKDWEGVAFVWNRKGTVDGKTIDFRGKYNYQSHCMKQSLGGASTYPINK